MVLKIAGVLNKLKTFISVLLYKVKMESLIEEAEDGNVSKVAELLSKIKDEEVLTLWYCVYITNGITYNYCKSCRYQMVFDFVGQFKTFKKPS